MLMKSLVCFAGLLIAFCGQAQSADFADDSHSRQADSSLARKQAHACENNDLTACITLGMYQKACNGQNTKGCTALAMLHEENRQTARARQLYRQACNHDDMLACSRLGMLVHDGQGGEPDPDQAFRLWSDACKEDEPLGCRLLRDYGVPMEGN